MLNVILWARYRSPKDGYIETDSHAKCGHLLLPEARSSSRKQRGSRLTGRRATKSCHHCSRTLGPFPTSHFWSFEEICILPNSTSQTEPLGMKRNRMWAFLCRSKFSSPSASSLEWSSNWKNQRLHTRSRVCSSRHWNKFCAYGGEEVIFCRVGSSLSWFIHFFESQGERNVVTQPQAKRFLWPEDCSSNWAWTSHPHHWKVFRGTLWQWRRWTWIPEISQRSLRI